MSYYYNTMSHRIPLGELCPDPRVIERALAVSAQYSSAVVDEMLYHRPCDDERYDDMDTERVEALANGAKDVPAIKAAKGSVYDFARSVLLRTDADWQGAFPHITRQEIAEFSKWILLTDAEAMQRTMDRHGISEEDRCVLTPRYARHIKHLAPDYAHRFEVTRPFALDQPPYIKQIGSASCSVSCYRMIFSGIMDGVVEPPKEHTLNTQAHNDPSFDEGALFRTFSSDVFKELSGRQVLNRIVIGATFDDIALRAAKVKQTQPETSVYTMLGIRSFDEDSGDNLHAVVLLDADGKKVTFHNPLDRTSFEPQNSPWQTGGSNETLGRDEFVARWASSLYTAHMVFAMPRKS